MDARTQKFLESFDRTRVDLGLERIRAFLERVGKPQEKMKYVHVAGTNGKGSTSKFIASALAEAGYRTGLYTSPHLLSLNERFQINGRNISDKALQNIVSKFLEENKASGINLSFFEFLTAIAFEYFAEKNCEYVVLEVGMGGRLDATNVVIPEVSIITSIGLEHTQFLGSSIEKIAGEKAGIIKEGIPVISDAQEANAMNVIRKKSHEMNASLSVLSRDFNFVKQRASLQGQEFDYASQQYRFKGLMTRMLGEYQFRNASLAVRALELLGVQEKAIRQGLKKAILPGRFQIIHNKPFVIADVAHNPAGAAALRKSIEEFFPAKKALFVLGVSSDKDVNAIVSELAPVACSFVCTQASFRGMPAEHVLGAVKESGFMGHSIMVSNPGKAVEFALKQSAEIVVLTGSFFSVGEELIVALK